MSRFIMPIILVGIAIGLFFTVTDPIYNKISALKAQVGSYNDALSNSKALENERDKLTAKYNTIDPVNLAKLEKLLPENVDNIRLILEIEKMATPYGMVLKDVKYNTADESAIPVAGIIKGSAINQASKDYGVFELQFSTSATYDNFINFTKTLESNLRIVDVSSITFSSSAGSTPGLLSKTSSADVYKYDFKIKTYWLKN